jgi:hypothetical protein
VATEQLEEVMERRNLLAGLAMLALSLFMLSGTAVAHSTRHKQASGPGGGSKPETCVVHALPSSFMDQGEFSVASSVADVIEVECEPVYAEHHVTISANELYSRCDKRLTWLFTTPEGSVGAIGSHPSFTVELDNAGNATVVVIGGPSCAAGESLISAHLTEAPFTTVTTGFTVLPPRVTEPGVFATPATKVEDESTSSVATIVQVEFPPVFAEEPVNINASQLYARCHVGNKLTFVELTSEGLHFVPGEEVTDVSLDNDGNAFVILVGSASCAAGTSLIEASLEHAPYTTYTTDFTVEPPRPTFPE